MRTFHHVLVPIFVCGVVELGSADIIESFDVGEGLFTSTVQIDFANGNGYLFEVRWSSGTTTGWDLMTTIADEVDGFSLDYSTSEWGVFLQGIDAFGDSDWGIGAGWPDVEDYWHYWTKDSAADDWLFAMVGADVRTVSDGSWDGWVFLSAESPQPIGVPAPGGLLIGTLALFTCRSRRR
ncbi:MAG: hypothetical protein P8L37_07105 [Phycisphaerales bacterium]|nr:hypothetical protein [Phycisphaerales bacterium]